MLRMKSWRCRLDDASRAHANVRAWWRLVVAASLVVIALARPKQCPGESGTYRPIHVPIAAASPIMLVDDVVNMSASA